MNKLNNKAIIMVSISGGRTSGYMAIWMKQNKNLVAEWLGVDEVEFRYTFTNTGLEHPETLRFLNDIDVNFLNNEIVWVEAVAHHGERKGSSHKVVTYETASQYYDYEKESHPFHDHVKKYGIPNNSFLNCTRELKLNAINSYMRSIGLNEKKDFYTAIGIREDENRRVSKHAHVRNIIYPLVDLNPVDKQDVLDFWGEQEFDLDIPEWLGNCLTCYKKSDKKLALSYRDLPSGWDAFKFYEDNYSMIGPEFKKYDDAKPRVNFRHYRGVDQMIATFNLVGDSAEELSNHSSGECSESCEMYQTELIV